MSVFSKIFGSRGSRQYLVHGPQGGIHTSITLPEGFNPQEDKCPMVVLMHGFMASMNNHPIPAFAKALAKEGIASIRFDFDAHGKSEGKFIDMTLSSELADAEAVYRYAASLPYVSQLGVAGHSQGGVIAGLLAGKLEEDPKLKPAFAFLVAPAAVLKDDAIAGTCMGVKYNPADPPQYVNVFFHKLGRKFILEAQKYPIFEDSWRYTGPVCLVHGKADKIVPFSYSEKYNEGYKNSTLHLLEDENHFIRKRVAEVCQLLTDFVKQK